MQSVSLPVIKEMLFTAQPIPADRALQVASSTKWSPRTAWRPQPQN
jgi:hypothetical protein